MLDKWLMNNYNELMKFTDKLYKNYRYKYDILNDIIISIKEMSDERTSDLINRNKMYAYICKILYFSKFSKKSPQRKYLTYIEKELSSYEIADDDTIEQKVEFEDKIEKVYTLLYNKELNQKNGSVKLFEMYWLERFSYREISELTNMSYYRVNDNIKVIFNKIKKELSGCTYKN